MPLRTLLGSLVCWLVAVALFAEERFVLEVPDDASVEPSSALLVGSTLTVTDAAGGSFEYGRTPGQDSPDGRFRAYFSLAANQYLRWPATGRGAMFIGTPLGKSVQWRPSLMQVRRSGGDKAAPNFGLTFRPHLDVLPTDEQTLTAARVDEAGHLHLYHGLRDRWRHADPDVPAGLLFPGAPLRLRFEAGHPRVYTVGSEGALLELRSGEKPRKLALPEKVEFRPGSDFDLAADANSLSLFIVDVDGRLWELDAVGGDHHVVFNEPGHFVPGCPIRAVGPGGNVLLLIDRQGQLVSFRRDPVPGWTKPEILAEGFAPAGNLAAVDRPALKANGIYQTAAVDHAGRLRLLSGTLDPAWSDMPLTEDRFPPGSTVSLAETNPATANGVSISGVQADGAWVELYHDGAAWRSQLIATELPLRTPVMLALPGPSAFAIDADGRLLAATLVRRDESTRGEWEVAICPPDDFSSAPRLVQRKFIRARQIKPVQVEFANSGPEELVVRLVDARGPGLGKEIVIPPGGRQKVRADLDQGGTIEERFLMPGPGGQPFEQVVQVALPPQGFYDVVVYANRVTYQYIDRRVKKGPVPDFNERSLVSLGTFPLPPAPLLRDGTVIDVYRAAQFGFNPGAARVRDPLSP